MVQANSWRLGAHDLDGMSTGEPLELDVSEYPNLTILLVFLRLGCTSFGGSIFRWRTSAIFKPSSLNVADGFTTGLTPGLRSRLWLRCVLEATAMACSGRHRHVLWTVGSAS